jgi:hypothetical protein
MKVLSLLQPWASLVVMGDKKIETRSWNTKYRGPLLIHASKKYTGEQMKLGRSFNVKYGAGLGFVDDLSLGQIIGQIELAHVVESEFCFKGNEFQLNDQKWSLTEKELAFGDYSPGRYGWLLSNPILFKTGIPAKGSLGLWEYNDQIPKEVVKHSPITTEKFARNVWVASCQVIDPLKSEVNQRGTSEQDAIDKLKKFLAS